VPQAGWTPAGDWASYPNRVVVSSPVFGSADLEADASLVERDREEEEGAAAPRPGSGWGGPLVILDGRDVMTSSNP
jgi:hypothetical protein